jgi:hypothetical protein
LNDKAPEVKGSSANPVQNAKAGQEPVDSDSKVPSLQQLLATVDRLHLDNEITDLQALRLRAELPIQYPQSRYVLKHFGAHLSIGVVFAFDVVPLPLGTIARVGWVAGARLTEMVRGNYDRARLHSLQVLLVAAIPWLGYVAYLIPLRKKNRSLAFVLANAAWMQRTGQSFEAALRRRSAVMSRLARRLVPLPWAGSP